MFIAEWHDPTSKDPFPKSPEYRKSFRRLKDVVEFSAGLPSIRIYVNWSPGKVRHIVQDGKRVSMAGRATVFERLEDS